MKKKLSLKLHSLEIDKAPFCGGRPSGYVARNLAKWVRPELVAEVEFRARTTDSLLRHASFKGLREDKAAEEVVAEAPRAAPAEQPNTPAVPSRAAPARKPAAARKGVAGVPARTFNGYCPMTLRPFPEALTGYWCRVANKALPFLARRPLTLVRHVNGVTFFHEGPLPPVLLETRQAKHKEDPQTVSASQSPFVHSGSDHGRATTMQSSSKLVRLVFAERR